MGFVWYGEQVKDRLHREIVDRLETACQLVEGDAKSLIKEPYPPASEPGEPPHSRRFTQGLLGSVFHQVDPKRQRGIVGTSMKHGLFLEIGTRTMRPRRWLTVAFSRLRSRVTAILTKPID